MKNSLCPALLLVVAAATTAWDLSFSDDSFEYHGYLRSGVLESCEGGKGVPFQAPGAHAKYRLGNEAETYGEAILQKNFCESDEGPRATVATLLAFQTLQDNQWSADTDEFTVREVYAEFDRLTLAPGLKVWAGNRYYRRSSIHINDFYWLDTSGYGGGVQEIPVGDKLRAHIAYLRGSPSAGPELLGIGQISKQTLDLRLSGIPVGFGELELVVLPSYMKGGEYETELVRGDETTNVVTQVDTEHGIGLCAIHTKEFEGGFNRAAIQWGKGIGIDFAASLWAVPSRVTEDSQRLRVLNYGVWQPNESFALMYVGLWQTTDTGEKEGRKQDWFSVGARPTYYFTRNLSFAVEFGADRTILEGRGEDGADLDGTVAKVTVCPQLALDNLFWTRPVIRAFVTVAQWSEGFRGEVGGAPYAMDTSGCNFGVQMEAWF